jgi:hypothetical protein
MLSNKRSNTLAALLLFLANAADFFGTFGYPSTNARVMAAIASTSCKASMRCRVVFIRGVGK